MIGGGVRELGRYSLSDKSSPVAATGGPESHRRHVEIGSIDALGTLVKLRTARTRLFGLPAELPRGGLALVAPNARQDRLRAGFHHSRSYGPSPVSVWTRRT